MAFLVEQTTQRKTRYFIGPRTGIAGGKIDSDIDNPPDRQKFYLGQIDIIAQNDEQQPRTDIYIRKQIEYSLLLVRERADGEHRLIY